MNKEIKEKISSYKEEMIEKIIKYINIDSVWKPEECDEVNPFGEGVTEGFKQLVEDAKAEGFNASIFKNMVMDISLGEKSDDYVGIVCHFDVIPVRPELWDVKGPFDGWANDEFIYGRGSNDDKGPIIGVLYAMKIIKELNIPLKREVRLIVGGNEETDHIGINEYLKYHSAPTYGFTADSGFPLTNVEKGVLHGITTVNLPKGILSINGGVAVNAVVGDVTAKIIANDDVEKRFMNYIVENHLEGTCEKGNGYFELKLIGETAHGSAPQRGINAATHLLNFIDSYDSNDLSKFVTEAYHNKFEGEGFGLKVTEEEAKTMGQTSMSLGIIKTIGDKVVLHHDMRFPSVFKTDEIAKRVKERHRESFDEVSFDYKKLIKPLYISAESELVKTLIGAYNSITGEDAKPQISGGGTYAKDVPNILAFGMGLPGSKSGGGHGPNERLDIKDLVVGTEIFVKAIVDLANK